MASIINVDPFQAQRCMWAIPQSDLRWESISISAVVQIAGREDIKFRSDFGGTDIYAPLKDAFDKYKLDETQRIFLLTDGETGNKDGASKLIKANCI